ncbi:hypothetical protein ATER59S_00062 [Aquamicrobium terrae]
MGVRRAYDEAAKDERRRAIIDAADRLFSADHVLPTAARIAAATGLAKGTLYRYFESLETVFATLLLVRWSEALEELEGKLKAEVSPSNAVDTVLASFVALIESKPILMLLDGMLPEFKRGMSEEARQHFNATLSARMMKTGEAVERALDLPAGRGFQLLVRSHAFARGLWQSCDAVDGNGSTRTMPSSSFSQELTEALAEYWRGALQTGPAKGS